ncbi:MAG TPA: ChaN family lipoprotein [Polyangiaceae bacterium]|nr:ChaN family lipoprotein [Polyangiaceae bacterium]
MQTIRFQKRPRALRASLTLGAWAVASALCGCAHDAKPVGSTSPSALEAPRAPAAPPKPPARDTVPEDSVERAALPYHGLRASDGQMLSASELMDELAVADAICVGESHPNPHDHFAQLCVLRELSTRARTNGRELGLGLEMFEQNAQELLDDYSSREINERELLDRSEWRKRWGFSFSLYRPMIEVARRQGLALLALNAPRELTRQVARHGVKGLPEQERGSLPDMDFKNAEHRQHFHDAMRQHPHGHGSSENMYAAQVLWDESMADAAATWLAERAPARQLVILAGRGHCVTSGIPQRMQRRGITRTLNVAPRLGGEPEPEAGGEKTHFDYALIFEVSSEKPADSETPAASEKPVE